MKARALILSLLSLSILVGLPILAPTSEAALAWTTVFQSNTAGNTLENNGALVRTGTDTFVGSRHQLSTNDFVIDSCVISTVTCTTQTLASTNSPGYQNDLERVSNTELVTCWDEENSDDLFIARSLDSGSNWFTPGAIDTGDIRGCGVGSYAPGSYLISFFDDTSNKVRYGVSTDSGVTWNFGDVIASFGNSRVFTDIAAANTTTWSVVASDPTSSTTKACRTLNSGTAWTCTTVSALVIQGVRLQKVSSTVLVGALGHLSTGPYFIKSLDSGLSYTIKQISTEAAIFPSVANYDSALYGITWQRDNDVDTGRYSSSSDAGSTWSTGETVYTAPQIQATTGYSSGIDFLADGRVVVLTGFAHTTNARNDWVYRIATASTVQTAAADSVSITSGVGMYVERTGQILVARTDTGSFVRAYNAQNLAGGPTGSFNTANCAGVAVVGTMAQASANSVVAFTDCAVGGARTHLRLRNTQMATPTSPDGCGTGAGDACDKDLSLSAFYVNFPFIKDVDTFGATYGLSFDTAHRGSTDCNLPGLSRCAFVHPMAWSFSTAPTGGVPGRIGVATIVQKDNCGGTCDDDHGGSYRDYSGANTEVTQLCARDLSSGETLVGAEGGSNTVEYRTVITLSGSNDARTTVLDASMEQIWSGGGTINHWSAVSCAQNAVAGLQAGTTPSQIIIVRATDGQFLRAINLTGNGANRGLTLAENRPFGAFVDGTVFKIFNVTTGAVSNRTFTLPGGTFKDIFIDAGAQSVWVLTSTTISRYTVFQATTINPAPIICPTCAPGPTPATGPSFDFFGFSTTMTVGQKAILGIFLLVVAAVVGFVIFYRRKSREQSAARNGAGFFAAGMFMVNGVTGLFSGWVIFGVIVLVAGMFYLSRR